MAPEPSPQREMIKTLNPDVLTLDVEMPGTDGPSSMRSRDPADAAGDGRR